MLCFQVHSDFSSLFYSMEIQSYVFPVILLIFLKYISKRWVSKLDKIQIYAAITKQIQRKRKKKKSENTRAKKELRKKRDFTCNKKYGGYWKGCMRREYSAQNSLSIFLTPPKYTSGSYLLDIHLFKNLHLSDNHPMCIGALEILSGLKRNILKIKGLNVKHSPKNKA